MRDRPSPTWVIGRASRAASSPSHARALRSGAFRKLHLARERQGGRTTCNERTSAAAGVCAFVAPSCGEPPGASYLGARGIAPGRHCERAMGATPFDEVAGDGIGAARPPPCEVARGGAPSVRCGVRARAVGGRGVA
eukprot:scaffold2911_cov414-Prasinococcus_capsulatus_cf.AAC.29